MDHGCRALLLLADSLPFELIFQQAHSLVGRVDWWWCVWIPIVSLMTQIPWMSTEDHCHWLPHMVFHDAQKQIWCGWWPCYFWCLVVWLLQKIASGYVEWRGILIYSRWTSLLLRFPKASQRGLIKILLSTSDVYSATGKTVNAWNISGMFMVLWPITAKIRTHELATKPQTN